MAQCISSEIFATNTVCVMEKYRHWENAKYVKKSGCYIVCCHTTFSKTLYFHVLVVGKLGRLRKSHTTCKRCYLMLLLLDYHIPSFFRKKATLSTTNTTYVHYFVLLVFRCTVHKEIQCKKKSVVRNNATFPLLLHAITMLQKGIIGEGGERKKTSEKYEKTLCI